MRKKVRIKNDQFIEHSLIQIKGNSMMMEDLSFRGNREYVLQVFYILYISWNINRSTQIKGMGKKITPEQIKQWSEQVIWGEILEKLEETYIFNINLRKIFQLNCNTTDYQMQILYQRFAQSAIELFLFEIFSPLLIGNISISTTDTKNLAANFVGPSREETSRKSKEKCLLDIKRGFNKKKDTIGIRKDRNKKESRNQLKSRQRIEQQQRKSMKKSKSKKKQVKQSSNETSSKIQKQIFQQKQKQGPVQRQPQYHKLKKESSNKFKLTYCQIMTELKKNRRMQLMDFLFLVISIYSKFVCEQIFHEIQDLLIKIAEYLEKRKKHCFSPTNQSELLSMEQFTIVLLTYETTGNLISPKCYHYLFKKYIKRKIYHQKSNESYQVIQSLKYIKQNLNKNDFHLTKTRMKSKQTECFDVLKEIKSAFKILNQNKNSKKNGINFSFYKEKDPIDSTIRQFNMLLDYRETKFDQNDEIKQVSWEKGGKKVSVAFNYQHKIQSSEEKLQLKKKSTSLKFNYQKNYHSVQKMKQPFFHIKNRQDRSYHGSKQSKQDRSNWAELITGIKKKNMKGPFIQKFKPLSFSSDPKEHNDLRDYQYNQEPRILPLLKDNHQEDRERVGGYRLCYPGLNEQQDCNKMMELKREEIKLKDKSLDKSGQVFTDLYEFQKQNIWTVPKNISYESNKLRKKVRNIKKYQKIFEQKCFQRRSLIQPLH